MSRHLLVVAAHPDDETLGCGGLIARNRREGGEVTVVVLTEGSTTQYPDDPEMVFQKETETRRALDALGGARVEFCGLPDMALSTLEPARVNDAVTQAVERHRPDWVLVHHHGDLNRDHQVAHEAARVACRPGAVAVERLLAYETLSSTEWGVIPFDPVVFVALKSQDLERKLHGLDAFKSEIRPWPHPRSRTAVENLARLRGAQAGVPLAEAFQLVWERIGV